MIQNVKIHNFRGLRNIDVSVARLTVLIGPNNSGKTSFLQAIALAASNPTSNDISNHWKLDFNNEYSISLDDLSVTSNASRGRRAQMSIVENQQPDFTPVAFFRLPYDVKMSAAGFTDSQSANDLQLGSAGENVAAMVDFMLRRSRDRFDEMEKEATALIPGLQSLNVSTPTAQTRQLNLVMEDGFEMPAQHASAGVRLLLFFLALTHRPNPPKTVLIEEPENGIHPTRLEAIMRMLIRLADSKDGPQVILSTHSPYLLDYLLLDRHSVLVFQRTSDGGCTAKEIDVERLKPFLNEFMLGELWVNQGEQELIDEESNK